MTSALADFLPTPTVEFDGERYYLDYDRPYSIGKVGSFYGVAANFVRAYAWHISEPLDLPAMRESAAALVGTHDFAAFQSAGSDVVSTERTITRSELVERSGLLAYEVSGNGFLRHMVRAVVGTLVEVGRGRRPPGEMQALVAGRSRSDAGPTAPAHGLTLVKVEY